MSKQAVLWVVESRYVSGWEFVGDAFQRRSDAREFAKFCRDTSGMPQRVVKYIRGS